MPSINLASQRMNSGGGQGGLSPVSINGSTGAQLQAPSINVNAGNVKYSDMAPNEIVVDQTISQAGKAGMEMAEAAFQFSERQAQADADEAVLSYSSANSDSFYGSVDAEGNLTKGYDATEGGKAIDEAGKYTEDVNGRFAEALEGLSPSARSKAALRLGQHRNVALNRGAQHQAQQMKVREENIRTEENMAILEAIEVNPEEPWNNMAIEDHLKKYTDPKQKNAAREKLALATMKTAYGKTFESVGDPELAYQKAKAVMEPIMGGLDAKSKGVIRGKLNTMKEGSLRQAKAEAKANLKQDRQIADMVMPDKLSESMSVGNTKVFSGQLQVIRDLYPEDVASQEKKVVGALKTSIGQAASDPSNINVSAKYTAAANIYGEMRASGGLSKNEAVALDTYVYEGGLQKELNDKQNKKDTQNNAAFSQELRKRIMAGESIPFTIPSDDMNPEGKDVRNALYKDAVRLQTEVLAVEEISARQDFKVVIDAKFEEGTLSDNPDDGDMVWLNKLAKDKVIGHEEFNYAVNRMAEKRKAMGKKETHQTSENPTYKPGKEALKTIIQTGAIKHYMKTYEGFDTQPKNPKKGRALKEDDAEELLAFSKREQVLTAEMTTAYEARSRAEFAAGNLDWDSAQWAQDYALKTFYNSDKTAASNGFIDFLKQQSPGYQGAKLIGEGLDYIKKERYTR